MPRYPLPPVPPPGVPPGPQPGVPMRSGAPQPQPGQPPGGMPPPGAPPGLPGPPGAPVMPPGAPPVDPREMQRLAIIDALGGPIPIPNSGERSPAGPSTQPRPYVAPDATRKGRGY